MSDFAKTHDITAVTDPATYKRNVFMITKNAGDLIKRSGISKRAYTVHEWRKYTTPEERQLLNQADKKIVLNQFNVKPALRKTLLGSLVLEPIGGMLTAAATPGYDLEDLREIVDDPKYKTKALWIPGYADYHLLKLVGLQNRIRKRVEAMAREKQKIKK